VIVEEFGLPIIRLRNGRLSGMIMLLAMEAGETAATAPTLRSSLRFMNEIYDSSSIRLSAAPRGPTTSAAWIGALTGEGNGPVNN